MMKRYAAIDIGTNSILLTIVEYNDRKIKTLVDLCRITKLGKNLQNQQIHPESISKTLIVIQEYYNIILEYKVDDFIIIGTMALRNAQNSKEISHQIENITTKKIRIISGEEEAYLNFLSINHEPQFQSNSGLLIDIGGGSTEFIFSKNQAITRLFSIDIGIIRITELFFSKNEIIPDQNIHNASLQIKEEISHQIPFQEIQNLFGIGGTITTLSAIKHQLQTYSSEIVHGSKLSQPEINNMVQTFQQTTLKQRQAIPGLSPKRADVILAGTLILREILRYFNQTEIIVSDKGIRYGILYKEFFND